MLSFTQAQVTFETVIESQDSLVLKTVLSRRRNAFRPMETKTWLTDFAVSLSDFCLLLPGSCKDWSWRCSWRQSRTRRLTRWCLWRRCCRGGRRSTLSVGWGWPEGRHSFDVGVLPRAKAMKWHKTTLEQGARKWKTLFWWRKILFK